MEALYLVCRADRRAYDCLGPQDEPLRMRQVFVFLIVLALAGCAYDPPLLGDHQATKYRSDLAECRTSVDDKVDLQARATFPGFLISPLTSPPRKRSGIRACMTAKGYVLAGS